MPWLRNPYTAVLFAGHFDVVLFFILSGDALSYPFFHGGDVRYLGRAALKRYPRLTVPIVAVTAVTALAMAGGLVTAAEAGAAVGRPDWLGTFADFRASGATAIRFAFHAVYAGHPPRNYLPFLWTMPVELVGSFILLPALYLSARIRGGSLILVALAAELIAAGSFMGCFPIGALLGRARAAGVYGRLPRAVRRFGAPLGIALALGAVGYRQGFDRFDLVGHVAAGTALLLCIYSCPGLVAFLARSRVSQVLGRISYLLYLWHYTVLITLTSGLVVWRGGGEPLAQGAALAIGAASVTVSVALAWATLPIEGLTRRLNDALLRALWTDVPARPGCPSAKGGPAAAAP